MRQIAALICWLAALAGVTAQSSANGRAAGAEPAHPRWPRTRRGEEVYRAACITCHGPDGTGSPRTVVGFDTPLPDFTDCAFATAEADADWHAVVHEGGRIRGLDRRMPAFGDALSDAKIAAVIGYVRRFCADRSWPRGDLNLPRALFTEKAFPENEVVYTSTITRRRRGAVVGNEVVYERRFGARNQIEAVVPVNLAKQDGELVEPGLGDVARRLPPDVVREPPARNDRRGRRGSRPSRPAMRSAGSATATTSSSRSPCSDRSLPRNTFLQLHGGLELPSDPIRRRRKRICERAARLHPSGRTGASVAPGRRRSKCCGRDPFGGPAEWDVVPQLQVTLSKIQHVSVAGGVRIPLTQRDDRGAAVVSYLLWDWFDGRSRVLE